MSGLRILGEPLLDWHADYDPDDASVSVMVGLSWSFRTADFEAADLDWTAFARQVDDDIDRLMNTSAGREALAARLRKVLGPVGPLLDRALARRLEAMTAGGAP